NVCTCDQRTTNKNGISTCKPVGNNSLCDDDGGVDNKGAVLFGTFASTGVNIDDAITSDVGDGKKDLLLQVSGWNGKPNDREVQVGVLVSSGLAQGLGGCTPDDGKPHWCGHDKWNFPPETTVVIKDVTYPLYKAKAYVNNNQLVWSNENAVTLFFGTAA